MLVPVLISIISAPARVTGPSVRELVETFRTPATPLAEISRAPLTSTVPKLSGSAHIPSVTVI